MSKLNLHDEELHLPVQAERYINVDGVIHKMEFLFPSANDPDHVILLLLVVNGGTTRMFVYDWVCSYLVSKDPFRH
jgi:hypothetical protein